MGSFKSALFLAVAFAIVIGEARGSFCPAPEIVYPCTCGYDDFGENIICRDFGSLSEVKVVLDRIAENVAPDAIFRQLRFVSIGGPEAEIPANFMPSLKFEIIHLTYTKIDYISPLAFNATYETTRVLGMNKIGNIREDPEAERDFYDFLYQFKVATHISIHEAGPAHIPEYAFASPMPQLVELEYWNSSIRSIGPYAFSGLTNLQVLSIRHEKVIQTSGISVNAFDGLKKNVVVDLEHNNNLVELDEAKFRAVFEQAESIRFGGNYNCRWPDGCSGWNCPVICDYVAYNCGPQVNWLCENGMELGSKAAGISCDINRTDELVDYCNSISKSSA